MTYLCQGDKPGLDALAARLGVAPHRDDSVDDRVLYALRPERGRVRPDRPDQRRPRQARRLGQLVTEQRHLTPDELRAARVEIRHAIVAAAYDWWQAGAMKKQQRRHAEDRLSRAVDDLIRSYVPGQRP